MNIFYLILLAYVLPLFSLAAQEEDSFFESYIEALNERKFEEIQDYLANDLVLMEGTEVISRGLDNFYIHFQWDSVFQPEYTLLDVNVTDSNTMELIIRKRCTRIDFLHEGSIEVKTMCEMEDGKILKMATVDYPVFDFKKWSAKRSELENWINTHYPEMNGFRYDLTKAGALKYLKAIELFEKQ